MGDKWKKRKKKKRQDRFPLSLYGVYWIVLLLMSGIHTGLIIWITEYNHLHPGIQTMVPLVYWGLVAAGLTLFTRRKMRQTYEDPMVEFAKATKKVAKGDFSIYLPTIHTADKLDYLDYMILDFNKMVEELGSIETLKSDFISNVSHEMKTPIAVIKNYSTLLKKENLTDEERLEYVKTIEDAATRLNNLISNILKLNKLENQRIQPEPETYDVCEQICDCVFAAESLLDQKEIELDAELDERIFVKADKGLMELVWNNLISNAIKFSNLGGLLEIHCQLEKDAVKVAFTDHGIGMTEETRSRIFDKFYQGDTSHATEGNGLGLALAYRVTELMGGTLDVQSEYGRGSTFYVTLPVVENKNE